MAYTTTSLTNTAESVPPTTIVSANSRPGDARRGGGIKARFGELCRQDHQAEHQDQGREFDRACRRCAVDGAESEQDTGAQQRDAGAVDLEAGNATNRHADISGRENRDDDGRGHGR
jgi:hypothetical protein